MDGGRSTCAVGDNPDHLLKTVEGKWRSVAGIASTERKSEPEEILNRQRLCPASRNNIQSLQCLDNRMKFIPFVSQGVHERFPPMRKGRLHERAKCDFFLLTEPRALFRAQQHHRRGHLWSGAETLG